MAPLPLHRFHEERGAAFGEAGSRETVLSYRSPKAEYERLVSSAAALDFSFRGRLCILGQDREKFLHGQVTNDILRLAGGEGCYAALVNVKAKLESDLYIYKLKEELLLDFEPGLSEAIASRLERYVITGDVQVVDVSEAYGLLTVQGPASRSILFHSGWQQLPERLYSWSKAESPSGEIYLMRNPRVGTEGYDLFIPAGDLLTVAERLDGACGFAGWKAFETARIEAGIPRFGADMDFSNLPPEAGMEDRAISYSKGCYIGQEIIARIRTYGQVAKSLRSLRISEGPVPAPRTPLCTAAGKEVGYVTSATESPKFGSIVALGYVRKEANQPGTMLKLGNPEGADVAILSWPGA